jgi:hypothetical protein
MSKTGKTFNPKDLRIAWKGVVIEPMKTKEAEVPVEWRVELDIKGMAYVTVMASTRTEAWVKAWEHYNSGLELEGLELEVDGAYPQKVK